jgi:hypothetical protein
MDIIELIVGDETQTGFQISFWLPPKGAQSEAASGSDRKVLESLRSRHVVLLRNVALQVWQNRVYGQSLNRKQTRISTTITRLDGHAISGTITAVTKNKIERVEQWVLNFLGPSVANPKANPMIKKERRDQKRSLFHETELPPDTQ